MPFKSQDHLKSKRNDYVPLNSHGVDFPLDLILAIIQDSKKVQWLESLISINCKDCRLGRQLKAVFMPDFAEFFTKCSLIPDFHRQHLLDRVYNKEREDIFYNFSWWEPTLLALLPNLEELKIGVRSNGRECYYRSNSYTMELFKAVFCRATASIGLEKLHSLEVGDASLEDFTMLATLPSLRSLSMVAT